MEILQIVGIGMVATILVLILRQHRPELALQLSIVVGVLIVLLVINHIRGIINLLVDMAVRADINLIFLGILLRIIGIAYIAEFGAQICRDAGESSTAGKIELAAKVLILVMAIPMITAIFESILAFLP